MCTVYDRVYGDIPANNIVFHRINLCMYIVCMIVWPTTIIVIRPDNTHVLVCHIRIVSAPVCYYPYYLCACVLKSVLLVRSCVKVCIVSALVCYICRANQNRVYTPYMTVYLVISLPKIPWIHRIYMVLANPIYLCYINPHAFRKAPMAAPPPHTHTYTHT